MRSMTDLERKDTDEFFWSLFDRADVDTTPANRMNEKTSTWLRNLAAAVITGGCTTGLSALGIGAANLSGAPVSALDLKQAAILFVSGAVIGLLAYLKQSPIPPAA